MTREHWSNRAGFILATLGSAIGLGTLWKFPYMMSQNGSGLFLVFYFFFIIFFAIPLFIGELLIGRKSEKSAVPAFATLSGMHTKWKAVGWLGVLSSFFILSYYCVVAGWGLNYLMMSLNLFFNYHKSSDIPQLFDTLSSSGDISLFWGALFLLLTFAIVYKGILRGIEFWSRILMVTLVIFLVALAIYATTLKGFGSAIQFLFSFDLANFRFSSILQALGLSFFTMSLAQGILITYGSYLTHRDNILSTAAIIGFFIMLISLLCVMMLFPIIFTFALPVSQGAGLVFKTLPLLFANLPGSMLLSTLFFALFVFAALTSSVALMEVLCATLIDQFHLSRKKACFISLCAVFVAMIPSALAISQTLFAKWLSIFGLNFFDSLDQLVSNWMLPIGGLLTALYLGWKLDKRMLQEELYVHSTVRSYFSLWFFLVRWVVPVGVILIFFQNSGLINLDRLIKVK